MITVEIRKTLTECVSSKFIHWYKVNSIMQNKGTWILVNENKAHWKLF